ncbi:potassium transporter 5 [Quercus suber]|uniref:Potassium transporter 5 n=1 Tax=Quercus suber TaxID=58331 RepID=A0AAW0L4C8_QUESU
MSGNEEEEDVINKVRQQEVIKELKEKKDSSQKLRDLKWPVILNLAFQSIGVAYGDIGTSPLYVYASTFTDGIKQNDDILGVLSMIYYKLT